MLRSALMQVDRPPVFPSLPGAPSLAPPFFRNDPVETVLVIHGTFANAPHTAEALQWWKPDGAFCATLDRELAALGMRVRCWRHLTLVGGLDVPKHWVFSWSGENSEIARRYAGRMLSRTLGDLEKDPRISRYHIVCHSHGGNVLMHALTGMTIVPGRLGQVFFLGTPFLHFKRSKPVNWDWLFWFALIGSGVYLAYRLFHHQMSENLLPMAIVFWLVLLRRMRPRPVKLDGKNLGYRFLFVGIDEAFLALNHSLEIRNTATSLLKDIMKERHPFIPTFRLGFKYQATITDALFRIDGMANGNEAASLGAVRH